MAKVFISWGSPDQDAVEQLKAILEGARIDFFEYTDQMHAGDEIEQRILREIDEAKICLFCLSDNSVDREWVQKELHFFTMGKFLGEKSGRKKHLMPVQIGPLSKASIPNEIKNKDLYLADIVQTPDNSHCIDKLIKEICKELDLEKPRIIPATILAMTKKQSINLAHNLEHVEDLSSLCKKVGMAWDEESVLQLLSTRYGASLTDFTPFEDRRPMIRLVSDALNAINKKRKKGPTVLIRWYEPDLLLKDMPEGNPYWNHWASEKRLLVVDSFSMLETSIELQLIDLLEVTGSSIEWQALLWVPPYTRHTFEIQSLTRQITVKVNKLRQAFDEWATRPHCNFSFDCSTNAGLMHWLIDSVANLTREREALEDLRQDMKRIDGPGKKLW